MNFLEIFLVALYGFFLIVFCGAIIYFIFERFFTKGKESFEDRES
jgi:predicted permease